MKILGFEIRKIQKGRKTCLHPEFKTLTKFAFDIDGREFYEFASILDMPPARYFKAEELIREAQMCITVSDLKEILIESINGLNKGEITKSILLQNAILHRCDQFLETDTYYRLFSCLFFDLEEDLTDYDYDYNVEKIELFKNDPIGSFFLRMPMKKYLPQADISAEDLAIFLKQSEVSRKYLQKIRLNTLRNP